MFNSQKSMNKLRAGLIDALGKDVFISNIVDIADMINDLEYKQINISINYAVTLIQEIVTDKTKNYWRQVFKSEFANHNHHNPPQERKWRWMSSPEKIKYLLLIRRMKSSKMTWKRIARVLHVNAREVMRNVIRGNVYASELMRLIAHQIWEAGDKKYLPKLYK